MQILSKIKLKKIISPDLVLLLPVSEPDDSNKAHFLVYDFDGSKIDETVIQAMGEALRQNRP
jgi:hypothetical protein